MKIAYCIGALNLGGVGTVANNLSQYFFKRENEFHIITTHHKGNFYDTAEDLNWPVKDISNSEISLRKRMNSLYDLLIDYDVVINNHSDELLFILPALPNSIVKISVQHNTTIKSSKRLSVNSKYLHFSAGVSPAVVNAMKAYHKDANKLKVLPNGVSKIGVKTYSDQISEPLKLLFVGRLDNLQKNIFIFPKLLKTLIEEGVKSNITIAGSGEHKDELEHMFLELGMQNKYDFVGRVSSKELGKLFQTHDYVLNLSNWEGLPMVVLEAMSAGIIPILSNIEPHRFALGNDVSKLILSSDNSLNSYASIIKNLRNNSNNNIAISEKLVQRWNSKFSIKAFGDNYLNLINKGKNSDLNNTVVPLNKIKLPLKDAYKTTLIYNFAQSILRKTK